ncbi:MAG: DUF1549 domain-containing protein, partial [Planctomycetales bacterium]|nr:DUF1549 domain-containing protein [Planctomycetales bacterium]
MRQFRLMSNRSARHNSPLDASCVSVVVGLWVLLGTLGDAALARDTEQESTVRVLGLLERHCVACHDGADADGQLDLSSSRGIQRGGEHGPVIVPGRPDESSLFTRVHGGQMPPEGEPRLAPEDVQVLADWIASGAELPSSNETIDAAQVMPILWLRCTPCHGGRRTEAGLDLRTLESIERGGESGPVVVSGNPAESRLVRRVHAGEMPPRRLLVSVSVKPMEDAELRKLEAWIAAGLPPARLPPDVATLEPDSIVSDSDREFWAFQPPQPRLPPSATHTVGPSAENPIDAFLLKRLEELGFGYSSPADRATLMRRAAIDLTGIPPEPWEVERFAADTDPRAFERVIDRLLASPGYGERWARHWLDVAGYADSEGAQNEDRVRAEMWRYRDYVIRSFDADKPYGDFLREQIAGDELADWSDPRAITPEIADNLVATGYLRTAPDRTFAEITNFVPDRLEVIADEMRILGSSVLGLSLHCARCHDHKFDPIPQRDYYRMTALLKDALDEHDWLPPDQRRLNAVAWEEREAWESHEAQLSARVQQLQAAREAEPEAERQAEVDAEIQSLEQQRRPEPLVRAAWARGVP